MQIDKIQFAQVVENAKVKAAESPRWLAAIEKAADALMNGKWIVTELMDGVLITTSPTTTYKANGICSCKAFEHGQACKHRAAARLIDLYNEAMATPRADVETTAAILAPEVVATKAATSDDFGADVATSPRANLIAEITNIWPRFAPGVPLATELMARFKVNRLDMLADDMLKAVRLAIAM